MTRDRIKELRRVPASQLLLNKHNFRKHPEQQSSYLKAILEEVGIAGAVIARETATGELELIDGHLRREQLADELIPVLVLDVTEQEANKLLATFDPLSAMATTDKDKLDELLRSLSTSSEKLAEFFTSQAQQAGIVPPEFQPADEQEQRLDQRAKHTCPNCGTEF